MFFLLVKHVWVSKDDPNSSCRLGPFGLWGPLLFLSRHRENIEHMMTIWDCDPNWLSLFCWGYVETVIRTDFRMDASYRKKNMSRTCLSAWHFPSLFLWQRMSELWIALNYIHVVCLYFRWCSWQLLNVGWFKTYVSLLYKHKQRRFHLWWSNLVLFDRPTEWLSLGKSNGIDHVVICFVSKSYVSSDWGCFANLVFQECHLVFGSHISIVDLGANSHKHIS